MRLRCAKASSGEAEPRTALGSADGRGGAHRRCDRRGPRRAVPPPRRDRLAGRPRCTSRPARRRSSAGSGRSCSCRRSRSRRRRSAASGPASATGSRSSTRRSPRPSGATSASGSRRRGARRRRRALGRLRARARARPDRRRRGARRRRTSRTPTRATTRARWPRSARRSRAPSRSTAARRRGRRAGRASSGSSSAARLCGAAAARAGRRPPARGRLPALGAAARGARRGSPSDGGKAILLLNRRGVAPALHCRACGADDPLPELRRRARPPRRRAAPLPPLRPRRGGAGDLPGLRLARARADRRRHAAAGARARARSSRSSSGSASTPTRPRSRARSPRRCARFAAADRAVLLGTQMVAKGHHFAGRRARGGRRRRHRPRAAGLPRRGADVPAPHAARRPERPRRARAACSSRRSSPTRAPIAFAARHDVAGLPRRASSSAAASSATRRSATSCAILVSGPEPDAPCARSRSCKAGLGDDAELLGPAPLLRLRGRHRAQLVAKTDAPRALAGAGRAAARRRRAGDAPRRAHRGRRRRPAEPLEPPGLHSRPWRDEGGSGAAGASSTAEARGAAPARARADPPVPRPVLRMAAREVEQFDDDLAPARRADEAADARRAGRRARGDAGRHAPPALRLRAGRRGRADGARQPAARRPRRRRRRPTRRAASRCRACACRSSARRASTLEGKDPQGRTSARARGARRARRPARARPPRRRADHRPDRRRAPQARRSACCARSLSPRPLARCASPSPRRLRSARTSSSGSRRRHEVAYLLTRPDAPRGRGRKLAPPPAKEVAERLGIPVLQPERPADAELPVRTRSWSAPTAC